jgi:hypothetical protein
LERQKIPGGGEWIMNWQGESSLTLTLPSAAPDPIAFVMCLELAEPVARTTFIKTSTAVETGSDKGLPPAP